MSLIYIPLAIFLYVLVWVYRRATTRRSPHPYPPGPPPEPVIGNLRHVPTEFPWLK